MERARKRLNAAIDALAGMEPVFASALERVGYPDPRGRPPGYETLLRTIVGQQVSVASANAIWTKLERALGDAGDPALLLAAPDEALRSAGFSRQKMGYARSLAGLLVSGALDLTALPADDEEAIAALTRIRGIGRWSAEIYLLFAEERPDIWPAGDLAVQAEIARLFGLDARPGEKALRALGERWRPHRGAVAIFAWYHYKHSGKSGAPLG